MGSDYPGFRERASDSVRMLYNIMNQVFMLTTTDGSVTHRSGGRLLP